MTGHGGMIISNYGSTVILIKINCHLWVITFMLFLLLAILIFWFLLGKGYQLMLRDVCGTEREVLGKVNSARSLPYTYSVIMPQYVNCNIICGFWIGTFLPYRVYWITRTMWWAMCVPCGVWHWKFSKIARGGWYLVCTGMVRRLGG